MRFTIKGPGPYGYGDLDVEKHDDRSPPRDAEGDGRFGVDEEDEVAVDELVTSRRDPDPRREPLPRRPSGDIRDPET